MIENVLKACAAISAIAAVFILGRKVFVWWRPATASVSYTLVLDGTAPDSIRVSITNTSTSNVYVRSCSVRSTYTLPQLIRRHLKRPLLPPELYPNLRYNSAVYEFVRGEPVKIEPAQMRELEVKIYEHPLNAIYGPMLIAKVRLTTGQVIRSKRMPAPEVWRKIGRRGRQGSA